MVDEEHLARLRVGVDAWNAWRKEHSDIEVNLSGANLTGADLREANLTGADLREARLVGADLREARLVGADFRGARLMVADLSGVDLREARLMGADLRRARLMVADLSGVDLRGARLMVADLRGARLMVADLRGADLSGADLHEADLSGVDLSGAKLRGAKLRGADLHEADLTGADLHEADLRRPRADLSGVDLRRAKLRGADLRWVDLSGADLSGADLSGADLRGADLSGARLVGADFRGARLMVADLSGVDLSGADLSEPILKGPPRSLEAPVHHIHFTAYHPKEIKPKVWSTLLVYVHIPEMQSTVEADAKQRLEVSHGRRSAKATYNISRGAEIVVIPELPGCRFNPMSAHLLWLEDWHRVEFRLQAQGDLAGFELGKAVNGRVAFYVESVLVGEVSIWTCISDEADAVVADAPAGTASAKPYEAIFVSYAHEDSVVVDRLGRAYKALGMEFLRDIETLRSGEKWNPALLAMIERANIFQLYWSHTAKRSRYVGQEWRHALKQKRDHFIRPLYWQLPMPQPPRELAQLHFSYLKLDN